MKRKQLTHNQRLGLLRKVAGLTRAELSELSGINANTLFGYENKVRIPVEAWEVLEKVCRKKIADNQKLVDRI